MKIKTAMHFIYYSFAIIALLYELGNLFNPSKLLRFRVRTKGKKSEDLNKTDKTFLILLIGYFFWGCLGLFTSQWLLFLLWVAVGFIPKKWKFLIILDAVVSLLVIIFIIINRYHLHYSMQELINFVIK